MMEVVFHAAVRLSYTAEGLEMKYSRCQKARIERNVADDVQCVCTMQ